MEIHFCEHVASVMFTKRRSPNMRKPPALSASVFTTVFFGFRNADAPSAQWACQALEGRQAKGPEAR